MPSRNDQDIILSSNKIIFGAKINTNLDYTPVITPKRVTNDGVILAPRQLSSEEEMSQRWLAVGNTVPDFKVP